MTDELEVPVSRFCESLLAWATVMAENGGEENGMLSSGLGKGLTPDIIRQVYYTMTKSNLLYRLIYLGEPLRMEKCPKHDGRWSGCTWGNYCDCQKIILPDGKIAYDSNVTGWLLAGNPPATAQCGTRTRMPEVPGVYTENDPWARCSKVAGHDGPCDTLG